MVTQIKRLFSIRVVRYGLVGGIGIPVNDLALFFFSFLFGHLFSLAPDNNLLYAIASPCAFEVSTTVNFVLNQLFTYREQKLHGRDWIKRAGKAQLTSLSALILAYVIGLILVYVLHVDKYLANPLGIILAFVYNFFISSKLVFRPTAPATSPVAAEIETETGPVTTPHA